MPMNTGIKKLSALHRERERLRAKIATLTYDLAEIDRELADVAATIVGAEPPKEDGK